MVGTSVFIPPSRGDTAILVGGEAHLEVMIKGHDITMLGSFYHLADIIADVIERRLLLVYFRNIYIAYLYYLLADGCF